MRRKYFKCVILTLTLLLVSAIFSGCNINEKTNIETTSKTTTSKTVSQSPVEIEYLYCDNQYYPFREDWPILKKMEEITNVKFKFIVVPSANYEDRLNILTSTNSLPDLIDISSKQQYYTLGPEGLLEPINKNFDKIPNALPYFEQYDNYIRYLYASDGNLYAFPQIVHRFLIPFLNAVLYRSDRFEEAGIKTLPKTWEQLYEDMKIVKQKFPNDYVTYLDTTANIIDNWSYMFGSGPVTYLNSKTGKWTCGPIEENSKNMVRWIANAYKEGLIHPEFVKPDADRKSSSHLGLNEPVSILFENNWATAYEDQAKAKGTIIKLDYLDPLTWSNGDGGRLWLHTPVWPVPGWAISAKSKVKDDIFKFFNWQYSDEGTEFRWLGPAEYEITRVEGGSPLKGGKYWMTDKWLDPSLTLETNAYGALGYTRLFQVLHAQDDSNIDNYPRVYNFTNKMMAENRPYDYYELPATYMTLEQNKKYNEVVTNVRDLTLQFFEKCMIGTADIDKGWDEFVAKVKAYGIDDVLSTLDEATKKVLGK